MTIFRKTCQQVIVNDDIRFYTLLLHFFTHSENLYGVLGIGKSCRPELVTRYSTTGCSSLKTVIGNEGPWFIPNCRRARIWSRLCCNLLGALTSYMGVQNRVSTTGRIDSRKNTGSTPVHSDWDDHKAASLKTLLKEFRDVEANILDIGQLSASEKSVKGQWTKHSSIIFHCDTATA